jgi:hypothetical protein
MRTTKLTIQTKIHSYSQGDCKAIQKRDGVGIECEAFSRTKGWTGVSDECRFYPLMWMNNDTDA